MGKSRQRCSLDQRSRKRNSCHLSLPLKKEIVNFQNIASECGVTAPTVKGYFQILEDTLLGAWIPAFRKQIKRRVILSPKFYFLDVGVVAHLARRGMVRENSDLFGKAFEHFLILEVLAQARYSGLNYPVQYWRTASQFEVDLILGQGETAVEIKATPLAQDHHLKGLRAFREEYQLIRIFFSAEPARGPDFMSISHLAGVNEHKLRFGRCQGRPETQVGRRGGRRRRPKSRKSPGPSPLG